MKQIDFSSKNKYNKEQNWASAKSSLLVWFLPKGKKSLKYANYLHRKTHYTLWWNLSNSTVLQKTWFQTCIIQEHKIQTVTQLLFNCGISVDLYLRHNHGFESIILYPNTPIQWPFSENHWIKKIQKLKESVFPFSLYLLSVTEVSYFLFLLLFLTLFYQIPLHLVSDTSS